MAENLGELKILVVDQGAQVAPGGVRRPSEAISGSAAPSVAGASSASVGASGGRGAFGAIANPVGLAVGAGVAGVTGVTLLARSMNRLTNEMISNTRAVAGFNSELFNSQLRQRIFENNRDVIRARVLGPSIARLDDEQRRTAVSVEQMRLVVSAIGIDLKQLVQQQLNAGLDAIELTAKSEAVGAATIAVLLGLLKRAGVAQSATEDVLENLKAIREGLESDRALTDNRAAAADLERMIGFDIFTNALDVNPTNFQPLGAP